MPQTHVMNQTKSVHCESEKNLDPFSFGHNFSKYCLMLRILSLFQTEIIYPQTCNWICHFTYSLLVRYFEKCNHIHFFTETVE